MSTILGVCDDKHGMLYSRVGRSFRWSEIMLVHCDSVHVHVHVKN